MNAKTHCKNGHPRPADALESRTFDCPTCKELRYKRYAEKHAKPWTEDREHVNENGYEEAIRAQRVIHLMDCKWQASTVWERNDIQAKIDALTNKETQCRPSTT
jgi:L-rhamnose mutarotase